MHPHTIEYAIFGDRRVLADERTEILLCQALMNQRFTWCGSGLTLFLPFDGHVISMLAGSAPLRGAGRTRVHDSDWNAILALRFLAWVSTRLPGFEIRVRDESGFLSPSEIAFVDGVAHEVSIELDARPTADGGTNAMPSVKRSPGMRIEGRIYAPVPASLYPDIPEIAAAPISREDFATMTLDDIADRMLLPWDTERLGRFVPQQ